MSNDFTLQTKLKPVLEQKLKEVAEENGLTMSEIARRGIIKELNELE